jgi:uncharacterized protein YuzE
MTEERTVTTPPTEPQTDHAQLREDIENLLGEFDGVTVKRLIADEIVDRLVWPELDRLRAAHRRDLVRNTNISQGWSDEVERAGRLAEAADNVIRAVCDALGCGYDTDPVLKARKLRTEVERLNEQISTIKELYQRRCRNLETVRNRYRAERNEARDELRSLPAITAASLETDGEAGAWYLRVLDEPVARTTEQAGAVNVDWAADGRMVGVEVLSASGVPTPTPEQAVLEFLVARHEAGQRRELPRCYGMSSDALAYYGAGKRGEPIEGWDYPADPDDLGACERTYDMAPEHIKQRMLPVLEKFRAHVAKRYPEVVSRKEQQP